MDFAHLHVHDEFSLLDGVGSPKEYCQRAKELDFKYLAITNHGNVDGLIKLQKEAQATGIVPIFGAELYVVSDISVKEKGEKRRHIIVLVKNKTGWENLLQMLTIANLEGFNRRPRISPDILLKHYEGLVISTACTNSFILDDWGLKLLDDLCDRMKKDIYMEVMPHHWEEQVNFNEYCYDIAKKKGLKVIATNDCHYVKKGGEEAQEVLLAVQTKKKWKDPDRWKFSITDLYLKTKKEMFQTFRQQSSTKVSLWSEAVENTIEVAEKCSEFKIDRQEVLLPRADVGLMNMGDDESIQELCEIGMKKKILSDPIKKKKAKEYKDRLQFELEVIIKQNFCRYFLIVYELISWCKNNDIMVGPGRGSSAGSLVCYLLNITAADPIEHELIFARFISEARIDLPDIDMDFEDSKRNLIWKHLKEAYGEDCVAGVSTFSTMKGRAAIRDVSRVFDVPLADVNAATSSIVVRSGGDFRSDFTIADAFDTFEDGKKFKAKYPKITDIAISLEGQARGKGQHAAAIIISDESLRAGKRCSLLNGNKGEVITNWEKNDLEHVGLMKLDVLGLNALTILNETRKLILIRHNKDIDFESLPLTDKSIYKEFAAGNTLGIFQFGSLGLRKVCGEMEIDNFRILVNTNALFRPGTIRSGMLTEYILRRKGVNKWTYAHPFMKEITESTLGIIIYQEQVMRFMYDLGGLGWKTADTVRKVISKSQGTEQFLKFKKVFAEGCVKKKTLRYEEAEKLWEELSSFGSYSFNLSHAVVYSIIAYWMMYCKVYYPLEFYSCSLTFGSDTKKEELVESIIKSGIELFPPKIGISDATKWIIKENRIYCPFIEIKGFGEKTAIAAAEIEKEPLFKRRNRKSFFVREVKEEKKKTSKKFMALLEEIKAREDILCSEEDADKIKKYFVFSFARNRYNKYSKILELISDSISISKIKDIDYQLVNKNYRFYFGEMTEIKFGYREKIKNLAIGEAVGVGGNLGGVYGNFKDESDFSMLVFGQEAYNKKKDLIEHSKDKLLLVEANNPARTTSISCRRSWHEEDFISCNLEGLNLSLIRRRKFRPEDYNLESCDSCELRKSCKAPIAPSVGCKNIMIIGEAPGSSEDRLGEGFVGRSGKVVWDHLSKYGLDKEIFHITNAVKCFPASIKTPSKKHIKTCRKWLEKEIAYVSPVAILAFGNTNMQVFKEVDSGIMNMNGKTEWSDQYSSWICYCLHPATVLYHQENEKLFVEGISNFVRCLDVLGLK